ncbi:MBL fold metallo-hydrolase [Candidatus Parcubacteria bacterium]|nr:MBL fold metallo-hydrolase [Candidatus Parcubacteria bacterium]
MNFVRKGWREVLIVALLAANLSVWSVVYAHGETNLLHVYFLDVGQGDAVFIDSPTHAQVLIDGGPDRKVLSELGKIMPFGDRSIDVVIESHPDADHITGLIDVMKQYEVGVFLEPGVESENKIDDALVNIVDEKGIPRAMARRGMKIDLGDGAELLVLFPDRDVSGWETNDASVVAKLTYGARSFLLTGDSTKKAEYILLGIDDGILKSDILKAGHHGSKNSTSLIYAEAVAPEYGVISAGKNNRYGHPSKEATDILSKVGARIVSTIDLGTIEFETDGESLVLK